MYATHDALNRRSPTVNVSVNSFYSLLPGRANFAATGDVSSADFKSGGNGYAIVRLPNFYPNSPYIHYARYAPSDFCS